MSESLVVCDVAEDLVEKLRKFRFRKETHNAAIIMKIDKDKRLVVLDEELESPDFDFFNLRKTFIVYSYKYQHDDGRVSYPLCFIFSSPVGNQPLALLVSCGFGLCEFMTHVYFGVFCFLYRGKPSNNNNEKQESLGNLVGGKHDDMELRVPCVRAVEAEGQIPDGKALKGKIR
ncbi:hypothetical protein STEG23_034092, partial [Scotinomys teguina]